MGKTATQVPCKHYWIIEVNHAPTSKGQCRLCGEVREFHNTIDWSLRWYISATRQYYSKMKRSRAMIEAPGEDEAVKGVGT